MRTSFLLIQRVPPESYSLISTPYPILNNILFGECLTHPPRVTACRGRVIVDRASGAVQARTSLILCIFEVLSSKVGELVSSAYVVDFALPSPAGSQK